MANALDQGSTYPNAWDKQNPQSGKYPVDFEE